ncbi:MAG: hypothetical protein AB7E96_10720 [Deferribacterales bacterium]
MHLFSEQRKRPFVSQGEQGRDDDITTALSGAVCAGFVAPKIAVIVGIFFAL